MAKSPSWGRPAYTLSSRCSPALPTGTRTGCPLKHMIQRTARYAPPAPRRSNPAAAASPVLRKDIGRDTRSPNPCRQIEFRISRIWELTNKNRGTTVSILGYFECSSCKRPMLPGEFMAVIGSTPKDKLSIPFGRADKIVEQIGRIYCEECFREKWKSD